MEGFFATCTAMYTISQLNLSESSPPSVDLDTSEKQPFVFIFGSVSARTIPPDAAKIERRGGIVLPSFP